MSTQQLAVPQEILLAATPQGWVTAACARWPELLVDHLGCEKKAASTALALIFAYPDDAALTQALSRLARDGKFDVKKMKAAFASLGIDTEKIDPVRA